MSERTTDMSGTPMTDAFGGLRAAILGLAIGLLALGGLFHTEVEAAIGTWIDSTAYNHCFLVIPIAGWLIWERRASLHGLTAQPLPFAALLALPLAAAWLIAERLGIMEGRQLVVVSLMEVLFLAMLGWRLWRAVLGPLLYLYFMVPFGEFLTPKLQDITTWFTRHGLEVLGIPAYIDGYIIEIKEGTFFVAEACAGLRFLIASIAFGALYALMMYRSPVRRTVFIAISVVVPIVANGFRALGIVVLGQVLGSAEAAAADHVLYGWIFFSIVILILIVIGLPFRQDDQPEPPNAFPMSPDPAAPRRGLWAGVALAVLAAIGPASVFALTRASPVPGMNSAALDLGPGCVAVGEMSRPRGAVPGGVMVQRMLCEGVPLNIYVEVFSPRSTAGPVNAERRRLTRPRGADDVTDAPLFRGEADKPRGWRIVLADHPTHVAVAGLWVEGEPAIQGFSLRLSMARTSLTGSAFAPVLIVIEPAVEWAQVTSRQKNDMAALLTDLIVAHPGIGDRVVKSLAQSGQ